MSSFLLFVLCVMYCIIIIVMSVSFQPLVADISLALKIFFFINLVQLHPVGMTEFPLM